MVDDSNSSQQIHVSKTQIFFFVIINFVDTVFIKPYPLRNRVKSCVRILYENHIKQLYTLENVLLKKYEKNNVKQLLRSQSN